MRIWSQVECLSSDWFYHRITDETLVSCLMAYVSPQLGTETVFSPPPPPQLPPPHFPFSLISRRIFFTINKLITASARETSTFEAHNELPRHRWKKFKNFTKWEMLFCIFFWRARVLANPGLCRPFCIFERCLDSNPESCCSNQARYQLSHPSP